MPKKGSAAVRAYKSLSSGQKRAMGGSKTRAGKVAAGKAVRQGRIAAGKNPNTGGKRAPAKAAQSRASAPARSGTKPASGRAATPKKARKPGSAAKAAYESKYGKDMWSSGGRKGVISGGRAIRRERMKAGTNLKSGKGKITERQKKTRRVVRKAGKLK